MSGEELRNALNLRLFEHNNCDEVECNPVGTVEEASGAAIEAFAEWLRQSADAREAIESAGSPGGALEALALAALEALDDRPVPLDDFHVPGPPCEECGSTSGYTVTWKWERDLSPAGSRFEAQRKGEVWFSPVRAVPSVACENGHRAWEVPLVEMRPDRWAEHRGEGVPGPQGWEADVPPFGPQRRMDARITEVEYLRRRAVSDAAEAVQ